METISDEVFINVFIKQIPRLTTILNKLKEDCEGDVRKNEEIIKNK